MKASHGAAGIMRALTDEEAGVSADAGSRLYVWVPSNARVQVVIHGVGTMDWCIC